MSFRKLRNHDSVRRPSSRHGARHGCRRAGEGPLWVSAALAAAASALLFACLSDPDPKPRAGGGVSVDLHVLPAALAKAAAGAASRPTDSAHVLVTGAGMDPLAFGFGGAAGTLSLLDLPPGPARRFDVSLYNDGMLLYSGFAVADLAAEGKNTVSVECLPEFSRVSASVHIPADFPKTVAGGHLILAGEDASFTAAAETNGELRSFRLEEVPGDRDYDVSVALWDASGDTLARASRAGVRVPKGESVALVLPLTLTFSQLALAMTVGDPGLTSMVLALPGGRRVPSAFGDVVFSELYPVPTSDEGGDGAEWLELFNRAADTLDLSACGVTRDAGTSSSMVFAFPEGTTVPPGRGLVLGKADASFAHVTIGSSALSLTNSSARLELACDEGALSLDTLRYSTSASDSAAVRIAAASVSALRPSRILSRHAGDGWCLAARVGAAAPGASEEGAATPGELAGGCGE